MSAKFNLEFFFKLNVYTVIMSSSGSCGGVQERRVEKRERFVEKSHLSPPALEILAER